LEPIAQFLKLRKSTLELKILNSTYADFIIDINVVNQSNQTISYIIEAYALQPYRYYPFSFTKELPKPRVEINIESEKIGKLKVTLDEWGNAKAISSIEANSEDIISIKGWIDLTQNRYTTWKEIIEGNIGFSIRPEISYKEQTFFEITEIKVKLVYPKEYIKIDEANYKIKYINGYKAIEYSEEFYGNGYSLSFNMYKPRLPINSLILFLTLWIALILSIVMMKKK